MEANFDNHCKYLKDNHLLENNIRIYFLQYILYILLIAKNSCMLVFSHETPKERMICNSQHFLVAT